MNRANNYGVLVLLFPGFNTLDMAGPVEVLKMSADRDLFNVTIAAEEDITTSFEGVQIKRDIPIDDALLVSIGHYDVLVVPGGPLSIVETQAKNLNQPFMKTIQVFENISVSETGPKVLLSVCTGAIFLGILGIFRGIKCTTHWACLDSLRKTIEREDKDGEPAKQVISSRFVDAGPNKVGVRIISSGGVSCGIDASLHIVQLFANKDTAVKTAKLLDYPYQMRLHATG